MVTVAVYDQRPYVVNQKKDPNFVGILRGGFGNPFNISTESLKPLAHDMSAALVKAFKKSGAKAAPLYLWPSLNKDQVIQKFKNTNSEKLLLLTLLDWKSDSMCQTVIIFDLEIEVFDKSGRLLANKTTKGVKNLGSSSGMSSRLKTDLVHAYQEILEELFSNDIQEALKG